MRPARPIWILSAALAACAAPSPAQWEKPGASQTAVNETMQECRVQARLASEPAIRARDPETPGALMVQLEERDAREAQQFQICMQAKGYSAKR